MNETIKYILKNIKINKHKTCKTNFSNDKLVKEEKDTRSDKYLFSLFNDLKVCYSFVSNNNFIINSNKFKKYFIDKETLHRFLKPINTTFFPKVIKEYILQNTTQCVRYKTNVTNDKWVEIFFYPYKNYSEYKYKKYIKKIITWIYFINNLTQNNLTKSRGFYNCCKTLKIHIFMTNFEKQIMFESYENTPLGAININSGFTEFCPKDGIIIIYRNEEWFKVFIHETIHAFGLEFSILDISNSTKKLNKTFVLGKEKIQINVFESYVEFWARIINIMFFLLDKYSINEINKEKIEENNMIFYYVHKYKNIINNPGDVIEKIKKLIEFETLFSLFQVSKILDYMELKYENIIYSMTNKKTNKYKENSNVFAYYIVTSLLLYNYSDFLNWCYLENGKGLINFNKTTSTVDSFINFIIKISNSDAYMIDYKIIENFYEDIKQEINDKTKHNIYFYKILNNLQMSCIGYTSYTE